jgi:TRAP transporter TAXI family solute receptor
MLALWLTLHYVQPAPPGTITMATGTPGGGYEQAAKSYQKILARNGVTLKLVSSQGSLQNLKLLSDPHSDVDLALVQSGVTKTGEDAPDLISLGSMFYQPLMIFYRSGKPMVRLSELLGKRVAVGPEGSGTRYIAQVILTANGVGPKAVQLFDLEGEAARKALLQREVDAVLLTSDSASRTTIRAMLHEEGIRLFDFTRADAYLRIFPYLHKIVVPAGAIDIGEDLPPADLTLLAPTVDMIAKKNLHPALIDLLLEAATDVHYHRTTAMQAAGEFPKALANDFPLSPDASRYYKSGDRAFLYRIGMPFWLASLINRLWVMVLPLVVIVIPGLRYAPQLYRWRIESRIHHRYGELMALERESLSGELSDQRRLELLDRLNEIEHHILAYKVPGSHADQHYILRQHISFVRGHLTHRHGEPPVPPRHAVGA